MPKFILARNYTLLKTIQDELIYTLIYKYIYIFICKALSEITKFGLIVKSIDGVDSSKMRNICMGTFD